MNDDSILMEDPMIRDGLRKEVRVFSELMEAKLRRKASQHHDGWRTTPVGYLLSRLEDEFRELEDAIEDGVTDEIIDECVDVANFAMMIATNEVLGQQRRREERV